MNRRRPKNKINKIAALTLVLLLPFFALGQGSNLGNWLIYIGNKKLNSKWNIHNEVQYRNYNAIGDLEQLLLRTGVGYNLTEGNNLLLGYEQRFVESDFKMRLRYFLGFKIPLQYKEGGNNPLYVSLYNEIFLNTESSVFDRNRVFGGLGYKFSDNLRFELGYMNQFFEKSGRDQINLIAFVNL